VPGQRPSIPSFPSKRRVSLPAWGRASGDPLTHLHPDIQPHLSQQRDQHIDGEQMQLAAQQIGNARLT
jgi:hypothetical protein